MNLRMCRVVFVVSMAVFVRLPRPGLGQALIEPAAKYSAVAGTLEPFIQNELVGKEIPAISVALVDDQQVVWARGFGLANPKEKIAASAQTVYRVGSVTKLITDVGIMQLVEQGALDLDCPVTRYLPEFKPVNHSGKPITLRHLMAHRAGLVREPPIGHYFDPTSPSPGTNGAESESNGVGLCTRNTQQVFQRGGDSRWPCPGANSVRAVW
jgi:CubicO group peptidase (beta-lactamase class C family)